MRNMTKIGRGVAASGVAGLLSIGLATSAMADHIDPPTGSEANQAENWVDYVEAHDYMNVECTKLNDGFEGDSWVSDDDYALVVLKYATVNEEFWEVMEDDELFTDSEQDISHIIVCTADMEEETPTPTPSTSTSTSTPTPSTSTSTPVPPPSGPVVETDVPADAGSNGLPVVLGGAAVLAGLGLAAGAMRRKGQH